MNRNIRPSRPGGTIRRPEQEQPDHYEPSPSSSPPAGLPTNPRRRMDTQRSYGGRGDDGGGGFPQRGNARPPNTLSTGSTASTVSSTNSSLMDRMRVRSADTSTRTSFDDDYDQRGPKASGGSWAKPRQPAYDRRAEEDPQEEPMDPNSAGNSIWGRLTAAAGSLTVNVSKAWENGGVLQDGEETPPGGESRITRVLKAYYVERARSPLDLPVWLFAEHERQPTAAPNRPTWARKQGEGNNNPSSRRGRDASPEYEQQPTQRGGALRDVYDRAAAAPISRASPANFRDDQALGGGGENVSRATSRLKAFREAKRVQPSSSNTPPAAYDSPSPGAPLGRLQLPQDDQYGGYGSGRRPVAKSDIGVSPSRQRPSFDDSDREPPARRAPPQRAMGGLPSGPRGGGGLPTGPRAQRGY